ncbi:MAG: DUF4271 domain-containing protein [Prevotella sp.]
MFQNPDSIQAEVTSAAIEAHADSTHHHVLTPREVLKWLPADATPAQQDSAIQAHIRPSEIHWSECPDTLHLPGMPVGRSIHDVSLPKYYRESYFTGKPHFHSDMFGGRLGMAGDPVPYSIARDNVITLILLGCFMLAAVSMSKSLRFMSRQLKEFFRIHHGRVTDITETANELRFQLFLVMQTCLLQALVYFFYVETFVSDTFTIDQYAVTGIFASAIAAFHMVKAGAYWLTGVVFFGRRSTEMWMKSFLFILAIEGVAMFPVVMLQAYFYMPVKATLVCVLLIVLFFRILSMYRTYNIFFVRRRAYLQNFLYFCTLEIMPVVGLLGFLATVSSYLKVSF